MADSAVAVCNQALALLGDYQITGLNEASKQARLCNFWYPRVTRMVLEEHNWNCAKHQATLAKIAGASPVGWTYAYALPDDFIRLIRLEDGSSQYEVRGRTLCTDVDGAVMLYIRMVPDESYIPPLLADCIGLGLAQKIAFAITGDKELIPAITTLFERQMAKARGSDSQADAFATFIPDDWNNARF